METNENKVALPLEAIEIIDMAKQLQRDMQEFRAKYNVKYAAIDHTHDGYAATDHQHTDLQAAIEDLKTTIKNVATPTTLIRTDNKTISIDKLKEPVRIILQGGKEPARITSVVKSKGKVLFDEPSRIIPAEMYYMISVLPTDGITFVRFECIFNDGQK